ncbi:type II RES/Xre toxin-antitoxin system antitoxin [Paraburkholderia terricola]|uniref:Toxin-antitoxin system antitoxin component (TIGR02293 family) n=1 Tax=Paraburkholderia terricola TaxID=169427 RepID=A0ABU1M270_9BURK|nr:antitoxin Xre/MbcA/ParS toxin-binding domain-containing protein [Paraburkholderia terricola]MDR6413124.1 putative toxin-antitoxin system antitoxin component (TIGR02293 family) [Paraburkholderia terricola]MDR6450361.1 putative toxin-antitoxin system antitoxin component (TIGR02293 family) [Paraburkholderia terricola]MDR6485219.1 putative toxin-antitoxin system antitoxin component (TIGR02293 family) [Paraburkholderia terricola]
MTMQQPAGRRPARRATAGAHKAFAGSNGLGAHPHDFETFRKMDPLEQRRAIREGMEAIIVDRVAKELLHVPLQTLLGGLGLPSSTILRKISKEERLSGAESDRVARVLYVFEQATEVFDDDTLAAEWMQRPNGALGGLGPLEVLDSQPGYDRVRDLLMRVTFGVSV